MFSFHNPICIFYNPNEKYLRLSRRRYLSNRNQAIDLQSKSVDWFLYNGDLCHERVKTLPKICDKVFLWKWLSVKSRELFLLKSFIIDVLRGPKYVSAYAVNFKLVILLIR